MLYVTVEIGQQDRVKIHELGSLKSTKNTEEENEEECDAWFVYVWVNVCVCAKRIILYINPHTKLVYGLVVQIENENMWNGSSAV